MITTANTRTDPLAVHYGVMKAAGPRGFEDITRALAPREERLLSLVFGAIDADGQVLNEDKLAILTDPTLREAYLAGAEATR